MSAKNRDEHNRWRNITVGFRVSPEENEQINAAVALSGLPKQEYCYRRCLNWDIVVQGNPRVYKALRNQLAAVLTDDVLEWEGRASDLAALLQDSIQPNLLIRKLNVGKEKLAQLYSISYTYKRTKTGSLVRLNRIEGDDR